MEEMLKNPNKGKRKIPIEPIINKTKKQVTFSKRRVGLFKKASELCSLCGANVAVMTFSGAGKFFGFGHTSVEDVVQRYINSNAIKCNENFSVNGNGNGDDFGKFTRGFKDVLGQIEAEKRASNTSSSNNNNIFNNYINSNNNENNYKLWWDENIEELRLVELERYKVALEGLRNEVASRVDDINRSSMSVVVPRNFDFGTTRDGNTVAHHYQGYKNDRSINNCWVSHGMDRENCHQVSLPMDSSLLDMIMKIPA